MKREAIIIILTFFPLFASGKTVMPNRIRIIYDYSVVSERYIHLDTFHFLESYKSEVAVIGETIRNNYTAAISVLKDSTITDKEKLDILEHIIRRIGNDGFGMVVIEDYPSIEKLTHRITDLELTKETEKPYMDVFYLVLLDYEDHTDMLSMMSFDSLPIEYKGKYYRSSPVFFTVLDMIRDRDPIWREENKDFYKGHGNINYFPGLPDPLIEVEAIFNEIIKDTSIQ